MKTTHKLSALSVAFAGLLAGAAQATVLQPGASYSTFHSPGPFALGGDVLARNTQPVNAPGFTGILRAAVVRENEHHLNFYYQFERTGGDEDIGKLFLGHFGNDDLAEIYQSAAAFDIFTAGKQQASAAERSTGGTIGVVFGSGGTIDGSETSWTQVIRTHAENWQTGGAVAFDGWAQSLAGFQPGYGQPAGGGGQAPAVQAAVVPVESPAVPSPSITPPVPEPETYGMMLAGLGLLAMFARRRLFKPR